jgi:hypothetical protein
LLRVELLELELLGAELSQVGEGDWAEELLGILLFELELFGVELP